MIQKYNRHASRIALTTAAAFLCIATSVRVATADLLSGFDGNLSSATGIDWTSDGLTTQAFVSGYGVTQGTQALSITQPKSPPQLVDMKLITLNNVALVAANDLLLMDVTVPADVGAREVWLSFRGDGGLFANSPELELTGDPSVLSGTVVWNYAADGYKAIAASYAGSFWTIAIGIRGNDFNGGLPITTIVDNVRFAKAVPEPASVVLFVLGCVCMGVLQFRKRK